MSRVEELLAEIGAGNKCFAKINLEAEYHQIPLTQEFQPLTTIVTHVGTFQYSVMSFGVKAAPSCFQRIMQNLLKACPGTLAFQDDILIAGKTPSKLGSRRDQVERILDEENIRVNKSKTVREINQVDWLGYEISTEEIRLSKEKAEKIK